MKFCLFLHSYHTVYKCLHMELHLDQRAMYVFCSGINIMAWLLISRCAQWWSWLVIYACCMCSSAHGFVSSHMFVRSITHYNKARIIYLQRWRTYGIGLIRFSFITNSLFLFADSKTLQVAFTVYRMSLNTCFVLSQTHTFSRQIFIQDLY